MQRFYQINPNDEDSLNIDEIRESFNNLGSMIDKNCPPGRYKSLVYTKLEEACMFAIKSITHKERIENEFTN